MLLLWRWDTAIIRRMEDEEQELELVVAADDDLPRSGNIFLLFALLLRCCIFTNQEKRTDSETDEYKSFK